MKKIVLLVLLATALAGCEDFPVEGGDDFAGMVRHGVPAGIPDAPGDARHVGAVAGR